MSLADRLNNAHLKYAKQCKTCLWYDALSPDDQAAFDAFAERTDIARTSFWLLCVEEGLNASLSSFKRHLMDCRTR